MQTQNAFTKTISKLLLNFLFLEVKGPVYHVTKLAFKGTVRLISRDSPLKEGIASLTTVWCSYRRKAGVYFRVPCDLNTAQLMLLTTVWCSYRRKAGVYFSVPCDLNTAQLLLLITVWCSYRKSRNQIFS